MKQIPIVECFKTIQAEGPGLGKPSLFIRVGGCDLRCRFKSESCDTPYAVYTPKQLAAEKPHLQFGYKKWDMMTVDQLFKKIEGQPIKHLVLTGGHPILYQQLFIELINKLDFLYPNVYTYEFETQGTIPIMSRLAERKNVTFNVSVKLKSSNQEDGYDNLRINANALHSFPIDRSVYKFVLSNQTEDIEEIEQILKIKQLPVYVMPEGISRDDVIANSQIVVDVAIAKGWRFSPREHVVIWNQKKGV